MIKRKSIIILGEETIEDIANILYQIVMGFDNILEIHAQVGEIEFTHYLTKKDLK